jgi:hypothetical protein
MEVKKARRKNILRSMKYNFVCYTYAHILKYSVTLPSTHAYLSAYTPLGVVSLSSC